MTPHNHTSAIGPQFRFVLWLITFLLFCALLLTTGLKHVHLKRDCNTIAFPWSSSLHTVNAGRNSICKTEYNIIEFYISLPFYWYIVCGDLITKKRACEFFSGWHPQMFGVTLVSHCVHCHQLNHHRLYSLYIYCSYFLALYRQEMRF